MERELLLAKRIWDAAALDSAELQALDPMKRTPITASSATC
jgi:hypothetical protein